MVSLHIWRFNRRQHQQKALPTHATQEDLEAFPSFFDMSKTVPLYKPCCMTAPSTVTY